jgi:hypothetical protein
MSTQAHIVQLHQKHDELEQALSDETQRPIPDAVRLQTLKRRKLKLKDEIERLQTTH